MSDALALAVAESGGSEFEDASVEETLAVVPDEDPQAAEAPEAAPTLAEPAGIEAVGDIETSDEDNTFGVDEDIEAAFALDEGPQPSAEEVPEDLALEADLKEATPRAQARIRALAADKKLLAEQHANFQTSAQQAYTQVQQQNAALNRQLIRSQRDHAALAAEVKTIRELGFQPQGQAEQDPNEAYISKFRDETVAKAQEAVNPEIAALRKELTDHKQGLIQQEQKQQSIMRRQTISSTVDGIVDRVLLPETFPAELKEQTVYPGGPTLHKALGNMILAEQYGKRCDAETAARNVNRTLKMAAQGIYRAHATTKGKKVAASQATPKLTSSRAHTTKAHTAVSMAKAQEAGFKDPLSMLIETDS